jgi:mRNA-degrading endonuclease HigB of HigAB toxin-antitoxin module
MRVVNIQLIHAYTASPARQKDARAWLATARQAAWAGPRDVRTDFPAATNNGAVWSFPLAPSGVVVTAAIRFMGGSGVVFVQQVM